MNKQGPRVKDITGQKFNKFTVIKFSHTEIRSKAGSIAWWECECECGTRQVVQGTRLRLGRIKSCGCSRNANMIEDLAGRRFGRLTVTRFDRTEGGVAWWESICDCGNLKICRAGHLKRGNTSSCGCLRLESNQAHGRQYGGYNRLADEEKAIRQIKRSYLASARSKSNEFRLSDDQFRTLIKENCHYCGQVPSGVISNEGREDYLYNGIDRKDNDIGYVDGNVVPCCRYCNYLKSARHYKEFLDIVEKIYKHSFNLNK